MRIETIPWLNGNPLANDYTASYARVAELFEYDPWEEASLRRRADWLDQAAHMRADRGALVEALLAYNDSVGNAPEAMASVRSLYEPGTLAIVGGQQAGLLTGPLLVIYKAITILQEARTAEIRLGRRVVPVFWIAGEDHDWDEVNHIFVQQPQGQPHKIKLDAEPKGRTPVSRFTVSAEEWEHILTVLSESLMDTEFKTQVIETLQSTAGASESLTVAFAHILVRLFGRHGLILLDSADPLLRQVEAPQFRRLVAESDRLNEANMAGRSKVEALGYVPQAEVSAGQTHLFLMHEKERLLLWREGTDFVDRRHTIRLSQAELLDIAEREPQRLSNGVLTRPLMQQFLFPVLGTVLGPGEIAYWALLRDAFRQLEMRMPILIPRLSFTLLEGNVQKQMTRFGIGMPDALDGLDARREAWLKAQDTLNLESRFAGVKAGFEELYRPLLELIAGINPGLGKLGDTNMQKIREQIDFLEARATDAFASQHEAGLRQWDRIEHSILPLGKPQERVYNLFAYTNKYGFEWLDELIASPHERDGMHRIVFL